MDSRNVSEGFLEKVVLLKRRPYKEEGHGPYDPVGPITYCTVDGDDNFAGFSLFDGDTEVTAFNETCVSFQENVIPEGPGHGPYRELAFEMTMVQAWSIRQIDKSGNIDIQISVKFFRNNTQLGPEIPLGEVMRRCSKAGDVPAQQYILPQPNNTPYRYQDLISILDRADDHCQLHFRYRDGDSCP